MTNNKIALKSGAWYTLSVFLTKGIGFITTPIFTRLLTKVDFGLYNNYTSWLSIISIFITLSLESTLISARFDYESDFDEYILSMLGLSGASVLFWFLVFQILKDSLVSLTHVDPIYLNIMILYLFFSPAVQMFITRERYLFKYKGSVFTSIVIAISTAFLSVIFVVNLDNKLFGRIIGSVIPTILLGFIFYVYFIKKVRQLKICYWKYAIPICLPYIPHLLAGTFLNSTDRIMIERFCGAEDTAIYSLAYTCGTMITLFVTALNSAYAPWLGEKLNLNAHDEIKRFSKVYIEVFMIIAFGIMVIAPDILFVLGGKTYMDAKYVIAPVAMGCVCQFLYTLFVNIEQFKKKTLGMAIATIIAAVINLTLNCIFIPKFGYLVAAYTTLAGFLALLLMHIYLVNRLKLLEVYSIKVVFLAVIIGLIGMVLITISYNYLLMRLFLMAFFIGGSFFYINKKKNILVILLKKRN